MCRRPMNAVLCSILLLTLAAGCATPSAPPPTVLVRPCLSPSQVPRRPPQRVEALPDQARPVDVLRTVLIELVELRGYAGTAGALLTECAR